MEEIQRTSIENLGKPEENPEISRESQEKTLYERRGQRAKTMKANIHLKQVKESSPKRPLRHSSGRFDILMERSDEEVATTPSQHSRAKAKTKAEADIMIFFFLCVFRFFSVHFYVFQPFWGY